VSIGFLPDFKAFIFGLIVGPIFSYVFVYMCPLFANKKEVIIIILWVFVLLLGKDPPQLYPWDFCHFCSTCGDYDQC